MTDTRRQTISAIRQRLEKAGSLQWFHWLVIGLSLGLTFLAWRYAVAQQDNKVQLQFDREAEQVVSLVVDRMSTYEEALWAGVAFVSSTDSDVDSQKWSEYATNLKLKERYPGVNGIGLIEVLNRDDQDAFIDRERKDRPDFRIHPEHDGDELWPIVAIAPVEGNEEAVGLDMAHEQNRIRAARQARDTGTAQVTGPITLVQDSAQTPGFLFFVPYYRQEIDQVPTRSLVLDGLVYAPFVVRELMKGVLEKDRRRVGIRISDQDESLFDENVPTEPDFDPDPLLRKRKSVELYGRTWDFDIWSTKSFRASVSRRQSTWILLAGLLIDSLLLVLFYSVSSSARISLGLADAMTEELESFSLAATVNRVGIFDYDLKSDQMTWNDAAYELFGRDQNSFELGYQAVLSCIHPEDRQSVDERFKKAISEDEVFYTEPRVILPSGEVRHLLSRAVVFRDAQGTATRVLGANIDNTQTIEANRQLDVTQRMQKAIQDAAGVSMIVTNVSGTILSVNRTVEVMLGYSQGELENVQSLELLHETSEIQCRAAELSEAHGRPVDSGFEAIIGNPTHSEVEQREWTYVRKDGSQFPALVTVTALRDAGGMTTGYLAVAADISERKKADLAIRKSNEQLARSNEELAQFAYVASHDLQEPLRKVTSFCELLVEDCEDQISDDGKKYLGYITDGANRMRTLIQDLLAYSKIESGSDRIEQVNLNQVIDVALSDLSTAIEESGAVVSVDDMPLIDADPAQMTQLFQNLIGNAIKYRTEASPRVRVGCEMSKDQWLFKVDDNGIGIEPRFREQVFGIFKRLHGQDAYRGTGIGLSICKRIVERSGGRIWIEDSPEGGTRFCFVLGELNSTQA
ncbi:CHASE domain-containing protein [Rubripirellula amarantea]|nr:CHASE domain-containing protein [Rubripirellula amarantea]